MNSPLRHNFDELVLVNNIFNIDINEDYKQILSPTSKDPYFKIPGGDGKYQGQLNSKAAEGKPTYPDNSLYYALNLYNKNLREIMEKDSSIPKGYQDKLITESDNFKIFYQNDDGTYKLLENKTNFIHELTYNQHTFYFLTHHDAWLYLRSMVAVEAQKVNIKG